MEIDPAVRQGRSESQEGPGYQLEEPGEVLRTEAGRRFGDCLGAVDLVERGQPGRMVAIRSEQITDVPLDDVVGRNKRVDPTGQEVHAVESIGVSFGR